MAQTVLTSKITNYSQSLAIRISSDAFKITKKYMDEVQNQAAKIILENIKLQAKKLALLLDTSTMPSDIKAALAVLLPEMTLEQISRLLNILEAKYLDERTEEIDEKYKKELAEAVKSFEEKRESDKDKLLKQLNELMFTI